METLCRLSYRGLTPRRRRRSLESDARRREIEELGPLSELPRIKVSKNGPYLVNGEVEFVDAEGNVVETRAKAALCRCGQSATKPWCDGTHRTVGFEADDFAG